MAKKPPPLETRWKPGTSANPGGRPPNLLTQTKIKGLISKFSRMTEEELAAIAADPKSIWEEKTLAKHMLNAGDDISTLNFLFDRSIGKVKDVKEVTVVPKPTIVERLNGSQVILGAEVKQIEGEIEEC